jgi:hypothetical protein
MTNFTEMNRLVVAVYEKHAHGRFTLFGDEARTYRAEKNALLVEHGWDVEAFDEKVEEYASDIEVGE